MVTLGGPHSGVAVSFVQITTKINLFEINSNYQGGKNQEGRRFRVETVIFPM